MLTTRPIIRDIAAIAGVGKATASRALSGKGSVNEKVRERVRAVAQQLGYRPNPLVRAFHEGASKLIGLYTQLEPTWAFMEIMTGIDAELKANDYSLVIVSDSPGNGSTAKPKAPKTIHEGYIDGLLAFEVLPEYVFDAARHFNMPCVGINLRANPFSGVTLIDNDRMGGTRLAVRHLAQQGHRRIAGIYVGPVSSKKDIDFIENPENPWSQGYLQAMEEQNLPPLLLDHPTQNAELWLQRAYLLWPDLTAVVAQDMSSGYDLRLGAEKRGLKVPEDLSIICTNQSGFSLQPGSYLTAVESDYRQIGRLAAQRVVRHLMDPSEKASDDKVLVVPLRVIDFGTTRRMERETK